jgi:hypothetical protein
VYFVVIKQQRPDNCTHIPCTVTGPSLIRFVPSPTYYGIVTETFQSLMVISRAGTALVPRRHRAGHGTLRVSPGATPTTWFQAKNSQKTS